MSNTVVEKLEKSRQTLLDLSTRNRLLSLPRSATAKLLNIYDELSPEVYKALVQNGKSMSFAPGRAGTQQDETASEDSLDDEKGVTLPQPDDEPDEGGVARRHQDLKLQTKLTSEKLQHRLLQMYYDARTFVEEQGVNILYLALGQLKWFDRNAPDRERRAPLILLPVALERKSAADRFVLSWLQEDATENLSLTAKLKADFGLIMPEFQSGDDFEPAQYLERVRDVVSSQPNWEVLPNAMVLGFFSFAKFLMYRDLDPANWPEHARIEKQELITAALQDGFPSRDELPSEDSHVDELVSVSEQRHVVDADGSQTLAIEAVRKGTHLIIQGPPGTGKSQTITNIIAAAISDGKRVLFVSEKMAALEVVYRRLQSVGLGPACLELHSHHSNKRKVLEDLKATRDLGRPKLDRRDQVVNQLTGLRDELNQYCESMHKPMAPSGVTPYQAVGCLAKLHDVSLVGLPDLTEHAEQWTGEDLRARISLLRDLQAKASKLGLPAEHPWRGVGHDAVLKLDADRWLGSVPGVQACLAALRTAADELGHALRLSPAGHAAELVEQIEMSRIISGAPSIDRGTVADAIWATGLRELGELVSLGERCTAEVARLKGLFADSAWEADIASARRHIAAHGGSVLRVFVGAYRHAVTEINAHLKQPLPRSLPERLQLLDALIESQETRRALQSRAEEGRRAFGTYWKGEQSDWTELRAIVRWMSGTMGDGLGDRLRRLYASLPEPESCIAPGVEAERRLRAYIDAFSLVVENYRMDLQEAFSVSEFNHVAFDDADSRLAAWLQQPALLFDWVQYRSVKMQACGQGLKGVALAWESGVIDLEQMPRLVERDYYERLLRQAGREIPEFASFDGERHNNAVGLFRTLDKQRIELARAEAALAHFERIPRTNGGIGPMGALNGEIARKRGHMPLRRLFRIAGTAVQAIKPVFMMSPLSVAQFLEPGAVEFDMLVIDEASQIEPVDALGAMARCKQLVVVGDDRQLPPTRFFSRMTSEIEVEDEDDEAYIAGAGDVESILSLCMAKGMPSMMLRWHYRSRHQSLIAVSNQQFYRNALYIVPSPYTSASGLGLRFHHVTNGTFDSGGTRVNREEARVIARAIIDHAKQHPSQSLGVAAFSLQQKVAIQDELELLRRQHPETEAFFTDHPNEPFFIKNLENVQGDERDVIFISVAYARNANGYLPMKFGPISLDGGERRLNVLISRAKLRCEVFSSITADDIDLERGKGKGVAALKIFLSYAATGRLSIATRSGRDMDSVLEEEIKDTLVAAGLTVHPQVGIAGFFIDLAVLDDQRPGRYLLGIECDGANYHSSRSARDRDRLRQAVLEGHGWILHRVWSHDWFRQPHAEVAKILSAVEAAKHELDAREERSTAIAVPMQISFVDREDHTIIQVDSSTAAIDPYREASFAVPVDMELHEVPKAKMAQFVHQVVDTEGPIHFDEVVTRIRAMWGLQRAGSRIRQAIDVARQHLVVDGRIVQDREFLDLPGRPIRIRNRAGVTSTTLRRPEYLPPSEIRSAIQSVLRANLGGTKTEIPAAVADALGYGVVGSQLREAVLSHLEALCAQGSVEVSGDLYRVVEEGGATAVQ
jgi:very-short-patch-repair endonuclease/DNA polymerase III delta prime subunit